VTGEIREKADLYALDLTDVTWLGAPGAPENDRVEVAHLPGGGVAMRNSAETDGPVLRYTAAEWEAFALGTRDGEFDA
jgi:hypothetical protein